MAAPTPTDVNNTQVFKGKAFKPEPYQTFNSAPKVRPNPFTGLGQTDAYAKKHHVVEAPPTTVQEATQDT